MSPSPKYSIITTCKGRLHHLVRSLPAMLRQPLSEVIVVDYTCPDCTADHVAANFPAAKLVQVKDVPGFNPSHARNLGAQTATGDVFLFVDADIVLADSFIRAIEAALGPNEYAKFAEPVARQENSVQGTCVVHRRHFEAIGGYDDVFTNYGGEDLEFYDRLALAKVERRALDRTELVEVIDHGPEERGRFFAMEPASSFLVGKVYRIAMGMLMRLDNGSRVKRDLRAAIYKEITRLVGNMAKGEKNLQLQITIPDGRTDGLHDRWQFTRSILIRVDPRN